MPTIRSYNKRLESLRSERSSFISLYRELSDYHLGHRGRFLTSDRNKGHKRNTKQYNNTSRLSSRTLAAGMMAGITSPARPWFRLSTGEADLDSFKSVKQYLHFIQSLIYRVYSSSNTYNSLHMLYAELGTFGTAAMGVFEDFKDVVRCKPYTVGSYMLSPDGTGRIDTFYREYERTVGQVIKEFGVDNVSNSVKQLWDKGNTESWVKIVHVIEPNDDRDMNSPLSGDMPYRSAYYECDAGTKAGEDKFLLQSGFEDFPIMSPRWDITGEDIYGTDCPGMTALGDVKALQLGEKRFYQALDKVVSPPMQGPSSMRNKINGQNLQANDIVWHDSAGEGLRSVYDFRPDLGAMRATQSEVEQRISRAFYEDLFLMLANSDRRQITAREIAERHEEKLLMLGPVLERLHAELLDPLIDRTFNIIERSNLLPPPPQELQGRDLQVEYVSVMAQAQRLVATGSIERFAGFIGQSASIWPEMRHKFDAAQAADDYAEALGVNPKMVRSDDEVEEMQQAEQQAMAQQQAMEQGQTLANTAKTVSETDLSEDNALGAVMRNAGLV
jgi:hypothetical protein